MTSSIMGNWRDARLAELREWKVAALQKHARELGFKGMDPTKPFSLALWVAEEELRRIGAEATAEGQDDLEEEADLLPPFGEPEPTVAEPHWHNKILLNVDPRAMRTVSADSIVNVELPQFLEHFLRKNAQYGDRHRTSRGGLKGETVNLDRKFDLVWEIFWNGKVAEFENPRELLWDFIGSLLLMLDRMSIEEGRAIVADRAPEVMPDPQAY